MSLHCPATLLVTSPDRLPDLDHAELLERRVSCVYADADEKGTGVSAKAPAEALAVPVRTVKGLGAEADDEVAMHDALESIADLHRGETVLVVGRCLVEALPHMALDRRDRPGDPARFTVLECGDDGWALLPSPAASSPQSATPVVGPDEDLPVDPMGPPAG